MSAVPIDRSASAVPGVANKVLIVGRIDFVRKYTTRDAGDQFEHRVVLPAVDEYSTPQVVLVEGSRKLGREGEDVKVVATVGGYRDSYKDKNGDQILTARVKLRIAD